MHGGNIKRWKDGDLLWAENDWVKMAYAVSGDPAKIGNIGIVGDTYVEFITEKQARLWDVLK